MPRRNGNAAGQKAERDRQLHPQGVARTVPHDFKDGIVRGGERQK